MAASDNRILKKLLDRLFASLINGPSLNCRPHSSRQRVDLTQFAKLRDIAPEEVLRALLGSDRQVKVSAKVPAPKGQSGSAPRWTSAEKEEEEGELTPEQRAARQAFREQQAVFGKLRSIAEDARTYENDTGVHVLQIGFPLLSLPPGAGGRFGVTRRILAPLAFISLSLTIKAGPASSVVLECRNEGIDLVVPNLALLAWLESQTGQAVGDLFSDETGEQPWVEIASIARRVCELLQVELPELFKADEMPSDFKLAAAPRADDDEEDEGPRVIPTAVIGLYPMANQGLLRDMQALVGGEATTGPIESFLQVGVSLDAPPVVAGEGHSGAVEKRRRDFAEERLVTAADPCQARAVRLSRASRGLVVHGPPGTGKSQTIANIIGDHLARGERVLFVCDKRTALDVVVNRLDGMGLGAICAIVHDPQRDQRELYKNIREQLDALPDLKTEASADGQLSRADAELQKNHDELTEYYRSLMLRPDKDTASFHELIGHWLSLPSFNVELDPSSVSTLRLATVEQHAVRLGDLFERATKVGYVSNPWTTAAALRLDDFLITPTADLRRELQQLETAATTVDKTVDTSRPVSIPHDLPETATVWSGFADEVAKLGVSVPADERSGLLSLSADALADAVPLLDAVEDDVAQLTSGSADFQSMFANQAYRPASKTLTAQIEWLREFDATVTEFGSAMRGRDADKLDALLHQATQQIKKGADIGFMSGAKADPSAFPLDQFIPELAANAQCDTTDLLRAAREVDATANKAIQPFRSEATPMQIGTARAKLADDLESVHARTAPGIRRRLAAIDASKLNMMLARLQAAEPIAHAVEHQPLDPSILLVASASMPSPAVIEAEKRQLDEYEASQRSLFAFLAFGKKAAATKVVEKYGLGLNPPDVQRCRAFLEGVKQRLTLRLAIAEITGESVMTMADAELVDAHRSTNALANFLQRLQADTLLSDVAQGSRQWLAAEIQVSEWLQALRAAAPRSNAIEQLRMAITSQGVSADGARWLVGRALAGRSCLLPARLLALSADGARSSVDRAIASFTLARAAQRTLDAVELVVPDAQLSWNRADRLIASWYASRTIAQAITRLRTEAALRGTNEFAVPRLRTDAGVNEVVSALRAGVERIRQIGVFEASMGGSFISPEVRQQLVADARADRPTVPSVRALANRFDSLENVLRVREGIAALPDDLQSAAHQLVRQNVGSEVGVAVLRKTSASSEIMRRLRSDRLLTSLDAQHLQSQFRRCLELDTAKKRLTRQSILHRWGSQQKTKLLASTGTRLNSAGADLRRRLTMRGERAMRLRQVIGVGQNMEGGDPLYDLRPVWMASPETVAQIFPRIPLFDVVIFDEASQCRLEEALPVLLRAKRVVIAGDPKQLPPTRFFESAVAVSEDVEAETEQQLFESQQGEIEDLLAAALNIEIEECYLDVHYRSRNAALIEFSNDNFYNHRLQAIPGHPKNRARFAPLTLYKAAGIYEKRTNVIEAERVVQIVRDLLKRAEPPTIGVACFNIAQRDLIVEKLDEAAAEDVAFGRALAAARERRTASSFEGLFVKNLENVQGDERDHIIISTTYGPDPKGRFYRRFGPIGSAGGGRRLNVLVTRARDEVHLVTSIPETVYRNVPPVPSGETPGGAWLLFAYLMYAEQLAALYEREHDSASQATAAATPVVHERPTRFPSAFALQLAKRLQTQDQFGSDVHWGNDGFCMDVAIHHPMRAEDVTIGVLSDMNRFGQAADPVEWEVFRTAILEAQGWTLSRVWTPHFFRDPAAGVEAIKRRVAEFLENDDDPDAIPTAPAS